MVLRADVLFALAFTVGIGLAIQGSADVPPVADRTDVDGAVAVSFADDIMPIFELRCVECHDADNTELGLRLDSWEGTMAGSDYGTVIEPGDSEGSVLVDMIASGDMPEDGDPVEPEELALIEAWVTEGAENN
jgi:hypothetical protein